MALSRRTGSTPFRALSGQGSWMRNDGPCCPVLMFVLTIFKWCCKRCRRTDQWQESRADSLSGEVCCHWRKRLGMERQTTADLKTQPGVNHHSLTAARDKAAEQAADDCVIVGHTRCASRAV